MAIWDFMQMLGGDEAAQAAPAAPQAQGMMDRIFGDPNNLRMMGEFGSAFSQGKPFGQAAGDAAASNARRVAMQQAGAQTGEKQKTLVEQLVQALVGDDPRKLVGPKEDGKTFNGLSIGPDGSLTLKAPGPGQPRIPGAQQSLESITNMNPEKESLGF